MASHRRTWWLAAVLFVGTATDATAQSADGIAAMAWLAGCWDFDEAGEGSGEFWTAPAGKTMLGLNRTVKDGRTIAYEFLRIAEDEQGRLSFVASPSGQATTSFGLVEIGDREAIFENPAHDFPRRIIYRRDGDDSVIAIAEGPDGDGWRRFVLHMRRTVCPGGRDTD